MKLVAPLVALVQDLNIIMTALTFRNFLGLLPGWVFARRRLLAGI